MADVANLVRIYGFVTRGDEVLLVQDCNTNLFTVPNKIVECVGCSTMAKQQELLSSFIVDETGLESKLRSSFRDQIIMDYRREGGVLRKVRQERHVGYEYPLEDEQEVKLSNAYIWHNWVQIREYFSYSFNNPLDIFFENLIEDKGKGKN